MKTRDNTTAKVTLSLALILALASLLGSSFPVMGNKGLSAPKPAA
jgi:hypothetical protein